jgi:PhzF family phenazine biosynthesis protein
MSKIIYQVDAFTDRPFRGNPAGVCILQEPASESWMQSIAVEMNLSETAFLVPVEDGFHLRWFTPAIEVALCGHATLASAHTLWETGALGAGCQARFHTLSGLLTADQKGDWIQMDFPSNPEQTADGLPELAEALGCAPIYIGRSKFYFLAELDSEEAVRSLKPDFEAIKALPARGVIVTAKPAPGKPYDFVSRFFAPAAGVNEDPVTGSAHCVLTPYWSQKLGKQELMAYQASPRGGVLRLTDQGDRVLISGQAVTVMKCELIL